ncbi:MAG TPA: hypothetical protein VHG72_08595 [Polyangia bacterium]|nr:hypothetical protein [Polyangia bacterium]
MAGVVLMGCGSSPRATSGSGGNSSSKGGTGAGIGGGAGGVAGSGGKGGAAGSAGKAGKAGAGGSSPHDGGLDRAATDSGRRDGGAPVDGSPGDAPDAYILTDGGPWGVPKRVHQTCVPPAGFDQPVTQLSATGCVDPNNPTQPAPSMIPYEVNSPLWSDGAAKQRFMAIPDDALISVKDCTRDPGACAPLADGGTTQPEGHWSLPVGSVLMKNFLFGGKLLETRLFMSYPGMWIGYSYQWNADQTDATIVDQDGLTTTIQNGDGGTQSWYFPSRNDCFQCHNATFGNSLGTETRQLNRTITYPNGVTANQIDTFEHLGMFDEPIPPLAPLADYTATTSTASLATKAESYLHANCAICHLPGGTFDSIDFRYGTSLAMMNVCNVAPEKGNEGVTGAERFYPGSPQKSVIVLRMQTPRTAPAGTNDDIRMPPLATSVLDENGIGIISQWISGTKTCP